MDKMIQAAVNLFKFSRLHIHIFWAIGLALVAGTCLNLWVSSPWDGIVLAQLQMGGQIFLNLLKMLIVPLITTALFLGLNTIPCRASLKSIGLKAALYFVGSSMLAIIVGLIMVNLLAPGVGAEIPLPEGTISIQTVTLQDMLVRIIPANPVEALAKFDMIGIIFFTFFFAVFALIVGGEDQKRLVNLMGSINRITMRAVSTIIRFSPLGVFCLLTSLIATTGSKLLYPLIGYICTVSLALLIHSFIVLPLLIKVFTNRKPFDFMRAMSPVLLTAFTTASSAAVLPMAIEEAKTKGGISERIANIVFPVGIAINLNGTALYEGVTVLFIAQAYGIDLSFAQQLIVLITALLASFGTAGIPHSGLVMMVTVLHAVGLPAEAAGLVWGVDRIVDMARTATNVWADCCGTLLIDALEQGTASLPDESLESSLLVS